MVEDGSAQATRRQATRLLPKLASLAISHADLLALVSCACGLIGLLLLPAFAKNTYISENALVPGSSSSKFMVQDAMDATRFARELRVATHNVTDEAMAVRSFLLGNLVTMGAEFYLHPFHPPDPPLSFMHFFSSNPMLTRSMCGGNLNTSQRLGINVVGIVRAPRGEGNEAIVLVTPYNPDSLTDAEVLSLGLGLSLFRLLSRAWWLAKDIIWVAADAQYGEHMAVSAWLKDYHEPTSLGGPTFQDLTSLLDISSGVFDEATASVLLEETTMGDFKRAGIIGAGVVVNLEGLKKREWSDYLTLRAEGPNGQMPNLDLINVVNNLAVYREGLHMKVDMAAGMLEWTWLQVAGQVLEKVGHLAAILNVGWHFGVSAADYVQGAATLTRSLTLQALGVPTGAHGAFRDYQIDAVTVVMSCALQLQAFHGGHLGSLIKFGRLLEGTIRSINNLLEKFHQSFFLYFLTGPNRFVSIGIYTIPLLLLLITLPLKAAALCSQASQRSPETPSDQAVLVHCGFSSCARWSFAVLTVCIIELWAFLVAVFPPVANHMAETVEHKLGLWLAFSAVGLCFALMLLVWMSRVLTVPDVEGGNWAAVKAATLGAATIGIGIMSTINFAAAMVGAVVLVPLCLTVYPLGCLRKERFHRWFLTGLSLSLVGVTPVALLAYSPLSVQHAKVNQAIVWEWVEYQWTWGSATYLYASLVHLPCSVLCVIVLLWKS